MLKFVCVFITVIGLISLIVTNSMYVEMNEAVIIVLTVSAFSVTLFLSQNTKKYKYLISLGGMFLLTLFLLLFDLVVDHVNLIKGVADGRFLTLGETLREFSDDLLFIVPTLLSLIFVISFMVVLVYSAFASMKKSSEI